MDNSFDVYRLTDSLKEHIMALVEKSMETFDDVGLVIENDGDVRFEKGSFNVKPKSIFRAQRADLINVIANEELRTVGIEIQVVKGGRGEAGRSAWFFKLPITLKEFQHKYPGYNLNKLIGNLKVAHDDNNEEAVLEISGVYSKDSHLCDYLNTIFSSMIRHTKKVNKGKVIELLVTDKGDLIAKFL